MTKKNSMLGGTRAILVMLAGCAAMSADAGFKPSGMAYVKLDGSVDATPIQNEAVLAAKSVTSAEDVLVDLDQVIHPNLSGIGGAFNEQGGEAFMRLPEDARATLAEALFNPKTGAGLTFCRTAIGSSDFGLGAYSYSETPEDYEMKHFSVERDAASVIPFIRAAMAENPDLKIFASPWSPPAWMKENGVMDPGEDHDRSKNVLKNDPKIYAAYALYFEKYVKAYAKHGVTIDRIIIQNETDMSPIYPGCDMLPAQMAELASGYIRPQFEKAGLDTGLWAGSFRGVGQRGARKNESLDFMKEPGSAAVDGLGLQYCRTDILEKLRESYPDQKLMHTEGSCADGKNNVKQARGRFGEIAMWLNSGCENYCYWNMVLNEDSESGWGWKQNSLVRIDRNSGEVFYNNDFAPVALMSRGIRPGDQLLKVTAPDGMNAVAVKGAERLVVFLQNDSEEAVTRNIGLSSGKTYAVELPAQALCAVVFN
jgi:glucosylceramidase